MKLTVFMCIILLLRLVEADEDPDIIVLSDLGIALTRIGNITSYKEVNTVGLQIKLKIPNLQTPQFILDSKIMISTLMAKVSQTRQKELHKKYKCVEAWESYEKHLRRALNTSHFCTNRMLHERKMKVQDRSKRDQLNQVEDNQAYFKTALEQQVTSSEVFVGTIETFELYLNNEIILDSCLFDVQTLYMDLVHDVASYKDRIRQLSILGMAGQFQLTDLFFDDLLFDSISDNDVVRRSDVSDPALLLKHARLLPVAGCQNFGDEYIGFSFVMTLPRLLRPSPVYEVLQTGFYPVEKNECYKVRESSQIIIEDGALFSFKGCREGLFGLCSDESFKRSLSLSCLTNSSLSSSCQLTKSNCSPYNLESLNTGVLITSTERATAFNGDGHALQHFAPNKATFIPWSVENEAVHVGTRILFNPSTYNNTLTLNMHYDANFTDLFRFDESDVLNISTIPELKNLNERIRKTESKVDLNFYDVKSTLGNFSIIDYVIIFFVAFLFICLLIVSIKLWKCCVRDERNLDSDYVC